MNLKIRTQFVLCAMLLLFLSTEDFAQISITSPAFSVTEDFSTLASSGTSSTVPTGWAFLETGTNANTIYTAGTGSSNAGDTYSFGLSGDSERAFGGLQSGSLTPTIGVSFTNNSGNTINSFDITYTGETWRVGGSNRSDGIQFQYSTNATSLNTGTWTSVAALDYFNPGFPTSPQSGSMIHSALISSTISGLSIANGTTFWLRWISVDVSGSDDGLAVDDFTLSNIVVPGPCSSITTLTCDVPVTASLSGSGSWNVNACGFSTPGSEMVYSFTPTNTGLHSLQVNSASGDYIDYFYKAAADGCSSTGWTCIADNIGTGSVIFGSLTAGVEYYILLDAETTAASTQNFQINCAAISPPANDHCEDAITLPAATATYCGTTIGADADTPNGGANCGTSADADGSGVWYTFQGDGQAWDFFFPQIGEDWDPEVNVYSGSCGNYTCVTGDDDSGGGLSAQFTVNTVSGTTYFVYVHPACGEEGCGVSDFCFDVSVPTTPVVLTCPTNQTESACLSQDTINAHFALWLATASGTGGCNGVLTNNNTGAPSACGGFTTVTFTYTSECAPTTTTCQATFTVTAPPSVVLTCPVNTTVASCQTQAGVDAQFAAWLATASGSGGCNGVLLNNSTGAPSACGGSTTVTFTYTSSCAPTTTTCQATFTVTAPSSVVLTCPVNTTVAACQTQADVDAAFTAWLATASGSGGCDGVLSNNNIGAPSAGGGSTTVTFTYTSSCAPMTTTCQATFTVTGAPPVVLTCPTNTTTAACQTQADVDTQFAAWLATASGSGGCNGVLSNNNIGAPAACGGSTTVTFTYTSSVDPMTTTCQATFTVAASTTPTVNCPVATTVSACLTQAQLDAAYAAWLASASVSDGCGGGTITNNAPAAPAICNPNANTITVTFTYSGGACQTVPVTCTSTFTVPAYSDFTVPANGASQVACPSQITQPTPPAVLDACGKTLTPTGPVVVNNPNPIACEGTRTYTWTYTDCAGHSHPWSHVVTVERQPFGVPANSGATVACPDQTDVQPIPPVVLSNCGEVLAPVITSTPKPGCEGNRNWVFTYTDCEGNTATWTFIYTVEFLDFTVPANETVNLDCPVEVVVPTPPSVMDNCGKTLVPTGPVITSTDNANGCESSRSYAWTYKDCEGNTHIWSKTFNFGYSSDFFVYPDGEVNVGCLSYAETGPIPPTIYSSCGEEISFTGPFVTETIDANGCSGVRKFTFIYTDCGGHSHPWNFTYYANDNEPPVGNCANVDVTDLDCIEDVPCPGDYDFSDKIHEMIATGNIYDVCSGDNINVELDSWSALWQCSDPDGDGIYTFGRTFYFRISDQCGNEMPSLCGVTYSGQCLPMETFLQSEWGNEGDLPSDATPSDTTDLETITKLLQQGPLTIGGSNRSLTLTDAQCLMNLVPGVGNPTILGNCIQTNCNGCNPAGPIGMKNTLATNTISLILNMRFNVQYHDLAMADIRNQGLGCIDIDDNIKTCDANGDCELRIFEMNGTEHVFPYTMGGLLALSNLYLDGNLSLSPGFNLVYAAAINISVVNVNAYWHDGMTPTSCPQAAGMPFTADNTGSKLQPTTKPQVKADKVFSLAPNPAGSEVTFRLAEMAEAMPVTVEIYSSLGQLMFSKDLGQVSTISQRIDVSGFNTGLYFVSVKAGGDRMEQKLVIARN